MRHLIQQIRSELPFDLPQSRICNGPCQGCSVKLLDYMENELLNWEMRLAGGEQPGFAELSGLAKSARRIKKALERNGL